MPLVRWLDPLDRRWPAFAACALLVIAASIHCAWEWQDVLRQIATARQLRLESQPIPLGWPKHGCPNEYGCLCRGATLAHSVSASDLDLLQPGPERLVLESISLTVDLAWLRRPPLADRCRDETACGSYLSGGTRCALLGCFLI
jgi:hypothetical protein